MNKVIQKQKMLKRLRQGPTSTLEFIEKDHIVRPAARAYELKQEGYDIRCQMIYYTDRDGNPQKKGVYFLVEEAYGDRNDTVA